VDHARRPKRIVSSPVGVTPRRCRTRFRTSAGAAARERRSATPETAAAILPAFDPIDVTALAKRLDLPVLVMHARGDAECPLRRGDYWRV
jgi:pimeloyl-ACP methyl ester carboxylesterase